MAVLMHEVWLDREGLPACVLAGPQGDAARALLTEDGPLDLVHRFEAGSHLEAMTVFHAYLGREPYTTAFPDLDGQPYPEEWRTLQELAGVFA